MVQKTFPELMWTNKTKLFEDDDVTVYIHFKYSEIIAGNGSILPRLGQTFRTNDKS